MEKTKLMQVRDALRINRVMAKDADGNYTREVTPKVITDAIALCEAELARVDEPVHLLAQRAWPNGESNWLPTCDESRALHKAECEAIAAINAKGTQ